MGNQSQKTSTQNNQEINPQLHQTSRLVMLGDSTLDNLVWVNKYDKCIKSQLQKSLPNHEIINFAADGFTSLDMIAGNQPHISHTARQQNNDPFPTSIDDKFQPLKELKKLKPSPEYAVLSVGGNDVREILGNMGLLEQRLGELFSNYPAIVEKIKSDNPQIKLMIMLQYRPSYVQQNYKVYQAMEQIPGQYHAIQKLNRLLEMVYNDGQIMQLAQKYKIPIIDLSNSFDINDTEMYVSQIEPSQKGGQTISNLISHVVKNHDFTNDSYLYSQFKDEPIKKELNPSINNKKWEVKL